MQRVSHFQDVECPHCWMFCRGDYYYLSEEFWLRAVSSGQKNLQRIYKVHLNLEAVVGLLFLGFFFIGGCQKNYKMTE